MALAVRDPRKIKQVKLPEPGTDVEREMRGAVLTEANKNFGYAADAFDTLGPLAKTLADLDIAPLSAREVENYKASKARTYETRPRRLVHVLLTFLGLAIGGGIFLKMWSMWPTDAGLQAYHSFSEGAVPVSPDWPMLLMPALFTAAIATIALNGIFATFFDQRLPAKRHTWTWERYPLAAGVKNRYPRYVPIHVLNLANQIFSACPGATFVVEELTETVNTIESIRREEARLAWLQDPFLIVSWGGESYYVAVWDEREFEARQ